MQEREKVKVSNKQFRVYEVKYVDQDEKLIIGKLSDLRMRIKQGLVRDKSSHSAGGKIKNTNAHKIIIR